MALENTGPALAAILLFFAGTLAAAAETVPDDHPVYVSIGTGIDFSRGDYGERDANGNQIETDVVSVPFFTKIEWEPVTFRASIPVLYVDGSNQIAALLNGGDSGGGGGGDGAANRQTTVGVGDVTTSLTYSYYPDRDSVLPIVDLSVGIKIPSARPKSLRSPGVDITLGVEIAKTFDRLSVFAGVRRRFKTDDDFDDIWLTSVGSAVKLAKWISLGVAWDFREGSTGFSPDSHEISPYASLRLSEHTRLTPYGVIGLTDGAPDWGVGTTISYEF